MPGTEAHDDKYNNPASGCGGRPKFTKPQNRQKNTESNGEDTNAEPVLSSERKAHVYTDGASTGSRGPGGYGVVILCDGKTEEISGGERDTTNLRMEITAACIALETIDQDYTVTVYSDASYLINCMRRGWHEKWRENGWFNHRKAPVANRDLWERLLEATQRHQEVKWRKVKGHSRSPSAHKNGNDRADELAVTAKKRIGTNETP